MDYSAVVRHTEPTPARMPIEPGHGVREPLTDPQLTNGRAMDGNPPLDAQRNQSGEEFPRRIKFQKYRIPLQGVAHEFLASLQIPDGRGRWLATDDDLRQPRMKPERAPQTVPQQQNAIHPPHIPDFPIRPRGVRRMVALHRQKTPVRAPVR